MSQPNINCNVCGGTEFTLDSGFYFCLECNTQSQDVREVVFDEYFGNQKATTRVLKKTNTPSNTGPNETLTSWEVLNYILKGTTDELLDLGAKQELKIVTLQLWATYLKNLDVAFTSVEVERRPKLGYAFKGSDAKIIYGVTDKQLKGRSWRSRSRSRSTSKSRSSSRSSVTSDALSSHSDGNTSATSGETRKSILRKLSIKKKALASAEYSQSQTPSRSFGQTLEDLNLSSDVAYKPPRLQITKHAKKLLSSTSASSIDDITERRKLMRIETCSIRNITVAKLAALSNLALALTNQDIQVSDYIRWVYEGHISLENPYKLLPEGTKLDPPCQRMLEQGHLSYTTCRDTMMLLCNELNIMLVPTPDVYRLIERYCLELQLPGDLTNISKSIHLLISDMKDHHSFNKRVYETHAMAIIIVAMKLLFSLDDCTEYTLSHTATELNRVVDGQMFVFSDWVKFIECRKAVVSVYHQPTRTAVYGDTMGRDSQLFTQHYGPRMEFTQLSDRVVHKRYALNKTWVEAMVRCLRKLGGNQPGMVEPIHFPASLTPLHSYCQILLRDHADKVSAASPVLSQDFTTHSLEFILSPDRTVALGLANDLQIFQRPEGAAAFFKVEKVIFKDCSKPIPKYNSNQTHINVGIVKNVQKVINKPEANNLEQENELENLDDSTSSLYSEVREIILEDSDEEEEMKDKAHNNPVKEEFPCYDRMLQLFETASQYWLIHVNLSKRFMSYDDFDVLAMQRFPSTFLWLLRECSRMMNVHTKDLYACVISIEKNMSSILKDGSKKKKHK